MSVVGAQHSVGSVRRTHFVDDVVNAEMAANGFAVLPERLDRARVGALLALYEGVRDEVGRDASGSFMPSMMIQRSDLRAKLWDGVRELLEPVVAPMFTPGTTEVIGGSFVSKPAAPNSARNPHQDPSVFDETVHVSISMWIPLMDSDEDNGTLWLLPGSHLMGNHIRPPDVDSLDEEVRQVALETSVPVELPAGSVLVIDGAVVHHSPPNETDRERIAAIGALKPAGSGMWYAKSDHGSPTGVAEIHDVGVGLYRSGDLVNPDLDPATLVSRTPYRPASRADLDASFAAR